MSVYYLKGQSNYGDSAGLTGYFYPLYTDASLINGVYHTHTFAGLDDVVFYMPMGEMNHAVSTAPSVSSYGGSAYQEYAVYGLNDEGIITYTDISTLDVKQVVSVAAYSPGAKASPRTRVTNVESSRVEDLIPVQLRESSETLIALLSDYYNYLNQQDQTSDIFNRIVSEQDIDETSLGYLDKLQKEIAKTVPDSKTLDKVSLYKRIVKYYSIRGSEESVLVFFRIFFDEFVEVMYPKDFLLKPSSGKWKNSDKIENYTDFIQGYANKDENFSEKNLNDIVSFRDNNNLQIATGQIRRVESINISETHPVNDNHIIELPANDFTLYDNTNLDEPTFKLNNPAAGGPAQAIALLKNGVTYTPAEGLDLSASSGALPGGYERAHVDLGQVYSSENITETTDEFSMVARVKNSMVENGNAIASIFNDAYAFPSHTLYNKEGKLGQEIWRWGSFYGYNADFKRGLTSIPINEWSTVATRGKRDSSATPAAGGSGYLDVSVNGEPWERLWDDSDYGTPTGFSINNFLTVAGAYDSKYSLSNFQEDGTKNGKPRYTTSASNLSKSGAGLGYHLLDNLSTFSTTEFEIYFEDDLTSSPLYLGSINDSGVYGAWILKPADGSIVNSVAFAVWFDIDNSVEMSEISANRGGDVGIAGQIPTSAINTTDFPVSTSIGNGDYGNHGPNDSGSARNNFYDVLKDYNRRLRNTNNNESQRKPWLHYQMRLYFISQGGSQYVSTGNAIEFVSNDKELTWVTTNDFLNVKDRSGHLRLGVHRFNHYYSGKILHFSYFNKEVSQSELDDIHEYYTSFNSNKWGLRVSVNEDASIIGAKEIVRLGEYTLTDTTGPKINAFWTYGEDKFGSVLTGFKVAGNSGTINWGDGSIPIAYADNIATQHTFGPSPALQGSYENRKGFLSDIDKIQDSNYWQDYSYEIRSGLPNAEWINEYLRLVHPAGMKLFAALLLQIVQKNIWTGYTDYGENNPQEDAQLARWLKKLTPPSRLSDVDENGYHMPFYQPGWLSSEARTLMLLIRALVFSGEDARSGGDRFERAVKLFISFFTELNAKTRDQRVLEQHQGAQKFLDIKTRVADYSYLTANELGNDEIKLSPSQSYESNLLSTILPWSLGQGTDASYGNNVKSWIQNGATSDNSRTYRNDPFSKLNITWIAADNNNFGSDNGGFISPLVPLNQNKTYRLSVWMKQQTDEGEKQLGFYSTILTGTGTEGFDAVTTANTTGTVNGSPVFFNDAADLPSNDEWYLFVGFLRSDDGSTQQDLTDAFGGIWDSKGNKVRNGENEFVIPATADSLRLITTHDNNNPSGTGDEVEIWGPRIDVVDGKEPSVQELIFPTIDSDILYNIKSRPSSQVVYKLNNFSTEVLGFTYASDLHSVVTNDINYGNQSNYNENLKFIDTTTIGSYYDVAISDMVNVEESGYVAPSRGLVRDSANISGGDQSGGGYQSGGEGDQSGGEGY